MPQSPWITSGSAQASEPLKIGEFARIGVALRGGRVALLKELHRQQIPRYISATQLLLGHHQVGREMLASLLLA